MTSFNDLWKHQLIAKRAKGTCLRIAQHKSNGAGCRLSFFPRWCFPVCSCLFTFQSKATVSTSLWLRYGLWHAGYGHLSNPLHALSWEAPLGFEEKLR